MDIAQIEPSQPPQQQRQQDMQRVRQALFFSAGFVLLLWLMLFAQQFFDWRLFSVQPLTAQGLLGLLAAPLLHGDSAHLLANSIALLMLGSLAGISVPRASVRALPLLWLGSGLGAWLLGQPGSYHLGASGLSHGLMFLLLTLGLLRRDRIAIASAMLAFLFYGGMLLTILPREVGVSWQAHLGGAIAGVVAAFLLRRADPAPLQKQYSWELDDAISDDDPENPDKAMLEPPRPAYVPVLRTPAPPPASAVVVQFRPRKEHDNSNQD